MPTTRRDRPLTRGRPRKPSRRFPPEVLTDAEVRALMDACGVYAVTAQRNRALLAFLYRCGARIGEALEVRPKDLDLDAGVVRLLVTKGGRPRTIGLDPGGAAAVRAWMATRATLGVGPTSPVFCATTGNRLTEGYVRRLLPRLGRVAGIAKRVHAHGLRHTHAAQLRAEGLDIGIISRQLGHVSIATTARYLDHLAPMAVIEAIGRRAW